MIHHVILGVSDVERSGKFYDSLLSPLGWRRHYEQDGTVGWGIAKPVFFISEGDEPSRNGVTSFRALGIVAVKAAWESGMSAGARSLHKPGETRWVGSGSYSAFLQDPDGHRLEITVGSD